MKEKLFIKIILIITIIISLVQVKQANTLFKDYQFAQQINQLNDQSRESFFNWYSERYKDKQTNLLGSLVFAISSIYSNEEQVETDDKLIINEKDSSQSIKKTASSSSSDTWQVKKQLDSEEREESSEQLTDLIEEQEELSDEIEIIDQQEAAEEIELNKEENEPNNNQQDNQQIADEQSSNQTTDLNNQQDHPIAKINGSTTGHIEEIIHFDAFDSIDPNNRSLSYLWNFGDGAIAHGVKVSHVYRLPAQYKIILTVTNSDYLSQIDEKNIKIMPSINSLLAGGPASEEENLGNNEENNDDDNSSDGGDEGDDNSSAGGDDDEDSNPPDDNLSDGEDNSAVLLEVPDTYFVTMTNMFVNSTTTQLEFISEQSVDYFSCQLTYDKNSTSTQTEWQNCSSPYHLTNLTEGHYSLSVKGKNSAGWEEIPAISQWTIDYTAPVSQLNDLPIISNQPQFVIDWQGEDNLSGVDYYQLTYWIDDTISTTINTTSTEYLFTGQDQIEYYFRLRSKDNANNWEEWSEIKQTSVQIPKLLFSEVKIAGYEFVELFNPADNDITPLNLANYQLNYFSEEGEKHWQLSNTTTTLLLAQDYFLINLFATKPYLPNLDLSIQTQPQLDDSLGLLTITYRPNGQIMDKINWQGQITTNQSLTRDFTDNEFILNEPTPQRSQQEDQCFLDDFENSQALTWQETEKDIWQIEDGQYALNLQTKNKEARSFVGNPLWTDYEVNLDINMLAGVDKYFLFRVASPTNYYGVNLRSWWYSQPAVYLIKRNQNGDSLLQKVNFPINNQQQYHLTVMVQGEKIKIFIDEQLVIEYVDNINPILQGKIGLVTWTGDCGVAQIRFDNVQVKSIKPTRFSANHQRDWLNDFLELSTKEKLNNEQKEYSVLTQSVKIKEFN